MRQAFMGIDVGSISTKGVILDEDRNILSSAYIWTEGAPMDAVKKLVGMLEEQFDKEQYQIVGTGTTGSARKLVGAMLGATIVKNEITAHAVGTTSFYPDVRTILEIGGQDSKIILVENGVAVGISSWRQRSNNAIPPAVKATASYMNSILAKMEAKAHGYAEAIMLNEVGLVCEGTGENLFIVRNGVLSTPPLSDGLLEGITRDTVLCLADDLEIPAVEESLTRSDLYIADEVFMTGSAAELTPVGSVDGRVIGKPGEITRALQDRFFDLVYGRIDEYADWLTEV